jgi:hypothetical protein
VDFLALLAHGASAASLLHESEFCLQLQDFVEGFNLLRECLRAKVGGSWETIQELLFELVEGLRDFPDFLFIQASITLSAHSPLFLGSSRTRLSNSFQSSMVYSSSIIRVRKTWSDISAPLRGVAPFLCPSLVRH